MTISPSVENPIQRKPIREDIYMKAAQLRMINTPGSLIEDRQYDISLKEVSLVTGNWNEISNFISPTNVSIDFYLILFVFEDYFLKKKFFRMRIQHSIGIIVHRNHH